MPTVEQKLGRRIAQLRQKAELTQAQLAEASDYSDDFIKTITGFDLAAWIRRDVVFHADMETVAYRHLTEGNLTKYLAW